MNRLAQETSPYLLQHADNPVDWYPWGDEAFAKARAEDKPVLLSVGYAACHWCHVMEHESFEDEATAVLMNERFVSVKVDREERPDVDSLYMDAVVALTGQGGWPMTVFLTPEGEPFLGGTYYPPEPRHGLPSFQQVLTAVSDAYRERRGDVSRQASAIVEAVRHSAELAPSTDPLTESMLGEATRALQRQFDREWGGWGGAPKFPQASTLEFLLRMHLRGDEDALPMVTQTLDAMAAGGMYDLVGGGFHRYSVDREWLVPHFEKMLYDNALLAAAYLHAWVVTGDERYRRVTEETLDYMLRELLLPEGGFASAQDADTDGVEGLDIHVDGRRRRTRGAAPAVRGRAIGAPRRVEPTTSGRVCSSSGNSDRSRSVTTRRSRRGTGWPWRHSPKRAADWSASTTSTRRTGSASSCSVRFRRRAAAPNVPRGRGEGHRLPRGLRRRGARPARAARRDGRAPLAPGGEPVRPASPSSSSPTTSAAASSSRPATGRSSSRARRISRTTRLRRATRCLPRCCFAWRGSTATTSSSTARSASSGSSTAL